MWPTTDLRHDHEALRAQLALPAVAAEVAEFVARFWEQLIYEAKQRGRGQAAAPAWSGERRRHRRLAVEVPVRLRGVDEPETAAWEAVSKNLSRRGVFCLAPSWKLLAEDARVAVRIDVPAEHQAKVGFSGLAGRGRVARIDDAIDGNGPSPHTRGVAIEFLAEADDAGH
jgi:hypothetical protein